MFGTSTTSDTVSALTSQDSSYATQMHALRCVSGRVRGSSVLVSVCREQMVMSGSLSSYGMDFTMGAKVSWLCWYGIMNQQVYRRGLQKNSYPEQEPPSRTSFSLYEIMLRPTQSEPFGIPLRTRMWKSWINHTKVQI